MQYSFHRGDDAQLIAGWVARRIPGCERGFGLCTAMSVLDGSRIAGAVVFHNYSPECGVMEMSAAADSTRWLTRPVLRAMHRYIFEDANCQMAVMRVSEKNRRMRRIGKAFGYQETVISRLRGRDEAESILTLTDDAWRDSKFR